MRVPFHCLQACGDTVFAAQGGKILSFSSRGDHLSTWEHPAGVDDSAARQENGASALSLEGPKADGPPSKRRKVDAGQGSGTDAATQEEDEEDAAPETAKETEAGKKRKGARNGDKRLSLKADERPMVQGMDVTSDGGYLVAFAGSDKTIWVFKHDGAGKLEQLSQRTMPKRPCSVALTADNQTILSADKFGDVYALPLVPAEPATDQREKEPTPQSGPSTPAATSRTFRMQANELTVHTKRNLRALEDQKLTLQKITAETKPDPTPQFEHTLLLGHVSMLTAVLPASHGARQYILTADRDEHIRVSRGIPHAHIVEGYCLGHAEFVSKLCIPPGRPEILLSGGGGPELFAWDWRLGTMLARADLLARVREVVPGVARLAVSGLYACRQEERGVGSATVVIAICERVPALFLFALSADNHVEYTQTVVLPGNPLSVVILGQGVSTELLVALDPSIVSDAQADPMETDIRDSPSLRIVDRKGAAGWQLSRDAFTDEAALASEGPDMSADELRKALYTTESLRKFDMEDLASMREANASAPQYEEKEDSRDDKRVELAV